MAGSRAADRIPQFLIETVGWRIDEMADGEIAGCCLTRERCFERFTIGNQPFVVRVAQVDAETHARRDHRGRIRLYLDPADREADEIVA